MSFSKSEIALAAAARAISAFWKTHSCKLIPNWTRNCMITYTNHYFCAQLVGNRKQVYCSKTVSLIYIFSVVINHFSVLIVLYYIWKSEGIVLLLFLWTVKLRQTFFKTCCQLSSRLPKFGKSFLKIIATIALHCGVGRGGGGATSPQYLYGCGQTDRHVYLESYTKDSTSTTISK